MRARRARHRRLQLAGGPDREEQPLPHRRPAVPDSTARAATRSRSSVRRARRRRSRAACARKGAGLRLPQRGGSRASSTRSRNGGFSGQIMPAEHPRGIGRDRRREVPREVRGPRRAQDADGRAQQHLLRIGRAGVLDTRLIRERARRRPRGAGAPRARRSGRASTPCSPSTSAAARCLPDLEALQSGEERASDEIARARRAGDDAAAQIGRMRDLGERESTLEAELAIVDAELARGARRRCPTFQPRRRRRGPRPADRRGAAVGARARPSRARGTADRHAERRAAVGRALRLPEGRSRAARARARPLGARAAARRGLRAGHPARARPRAGALRDRNAARHRTADLPARRRRAVPGGTSEVALASLHAGEILDAASLPRRYAGFSPCFRREAGAAGRDTRGIFRVHQFDKVEMFTFTSPSERGGARADPRDRGVAARELESPTASSTSRSVTSARPPRRSTTARRGCRARSATAS